MTKHTTRQRRHRPRKKPLDHFLDSVLDMLDTALSTMVFGAGAVLLGKVLGDPRPGPRVQLPPGVPLELAAEWDRLSGGCERGEPKPKHRAVEDHPRESVAAQAVQLVKGEDGVYRPNPDDKGCT